MSADVTRSELREHVPSAKANALFRHVKGRVVGPLEVD